jgi:hypothetical protein
MPLGGVGCGGQGRGGGGRRHGHRQLAQSAACVLQRHVRLAPPAAARRARPPVLTRPGPPKPPPPWLMMVLSSATTGRPSRSADATSGATRSPGNCAREGQAGAGGRGGMGAERQPRERRGRRAAGAQRERSGSAASAQRVRSGAAEQHAPGPTAPPPLPHLVAAAAGALVTVLALHPRRKEVPRERGQPAARSGGHFLAALVRSSGTGRVNRQRGDSGMPQAGAGLRHAPAAGGGGGAGAARRRGRRPPAGGGGGGGGRARRAQWVPPPLRALSRGAAPPPPPTQPWPGALCRPSPGQPLACVAPGSGPALPTRPRWA